MKATAFPQRAELGSRSARVLALVVGAYYVVVGLWAFLAPASFSGIAQFAPYNQHLFHDIGAFHTGVGVALVLGTLVRAALQPALLAGLVASILHVVSHLEDRALGGRPTDPVTLLLPCVLLVVAIALEYRAAGRSRMSSAAREVEG